jgi:hypothetical protein
VSRGEQHARPRCSDGWVLLGASVNMAPRYCWRCRHVNVCVCVCVHKVALAGQDQVSAGCLQRHMLAVRARVWRHSPWGLGVCHDQAPSSLPKKQRPCCTLLVHPVTLWGRRPLGYAPVHVGVPQVPALAHAAPATHACAHMGTPYGNLLAYVPQMPVQQLVL